MPPKIRPIRSTPTPNPRAMMIAALRSVDLGLGVTMSELEASRLLDLRYRDGSPVIVTSKPQTILDVLGLLRSIPVESAIAYLADQDNALQAHRNSPLLDKERDRLQRERDNLQTEIQAEEGIHQCDRCGGYRTIGYQKQVRSADEPMTTFLRCLKCGAKKRID